MSFKISIIYFAFLIPSLASFAYAKEQSEPANQPFLQKMTLVSGCEMKGSPYIDDGYLYALVLWDPVLDVNGKVVITDSIDGALYSLSDDEEYPLTYITYDEEENDYRFRDSIGGMWSSLFYVDVVDALIKEDFNPLIKNNGETLVDIARRKICDVEYKNIEKYLDWMSSNKDASHEETDPHP